MHYVTCDVATYCIGMAASMGATLLAAGTKGKRNALPHAEVMIHQVLGGARGPATDIEIRTRHLLRTKKLMNEILQKLTGQPLERIERTPTATTSCRPGRPRNTAWSITSWSDCRLDRLSPSQPSSLSEPCRVR